MNVKSTKSIKENVIKHSFIGFLNLAVATFNKIESISPAHSEWKE